MLRIQVRYYSSLRDIAGREAEVVYVDDIATVADLTGRIMNAHPALQPFEQSMLVARNAEYAGAGDPLSDNDVVDFMPPVSGG